SLDNKSVNELFAFNVKNQEYIVRILTRQPTAENEFYRFEKEAKLMQLFTQLKENISIAKKNQIHVPVPKLFHMESDDELIGYKFIIMEKINGKPLEVIWNDLTFETKAKVVTELAGIIKGIHSIDFDMFGEIEEYDCPRRYFSFTNFLKARVRKSILKLGKEKILPIKLITEVQKFIEMNLEQTNFGEKPILVHNDLNLTNILVSENGVLTIKAIIDFEWSFAGDPIVDLWELEEHLIKDEGLRKLFYEKYFDNKKANNIEEFSLEKRIYAAVSALETIAFGWVHFHPTEENINYVREILETTLLKK
nr:aminoglycoside phosphotransferase family protein [Asgard group archaeon]